MISALPWTWTWISLLAYSMLPLWPSGSSEKTYQVSQVIRTTPTHQSVVLKEIEGCPPIYRWVGIQLFLLCIVKLKKFKKYYFFAYIQADEDIYITEYIANDK